MIEQGKPDSPATAAWRVAKAFNRRAVLLQREAALRGQPMKLGTARLVILVIDECEGRGAGREGRAEWIGAVTP